VANARHFAEQTLADLPADLLDDVLIMVSEFATNAVVHAHTPYEVRIDRNEATLRIEVADAGRGVLTSPTPGSTTCTAEVCRSSRSSPIAGGLRRTNSPTSSGANADCRSAETLRMGTRLRDR
jgi:Histidine kinase-like ATPase domain